MMRMKENNSEANLNLEQRLKNFSEKLSKKYANINAIVLCGSRARGDFKRDSDYDLSIFHKGRKAEERIKKVFKEISPLIEIRLVNKKRFDYYLERHHPFLYCPFRDGKALYQKQKWFDEKKLEIMKLEPKRETALNYITNSIKVLSLFNLLKDPIYFEEGKKAANLLGFGILMYQGIFPLSPHSLPKQLKHVGFYSIGKTIRYVQNRYYKNNTSKITKKYIRSINEMKSFASKFLQKA